MRYKDTQKALSDGHRHFIFTESPGKPVEVLKWGPSWVRFKDAYNTYPISTNMKMFSDGGMYLYRKKP
jgi:hypothetical protein